MIHGEMTLAAKLSAGFSILVIGMFGLSWSQLALIDRLYTESRQLSQISLETASSSLKLRGQTARLRELSHKHLVLGDPAYKAEAERVRDQIEVHLDQLQALELGAEERQELGRLAEIWQTYATAVAEPSPPSGASGPGALGRADRNRLRARLDEIFDAFDAGFRRLEAASRASMVARVADSGERVERARWIAWGATLAGLLAAALVSLGIVRSLMRPLLRLARGTRVLADGNFDHRVPLRGGPELEALAADFNAMAQQLSELDQLKKDFLANVSHDLKTPLASIQEADRLLLEGIPGPLTSQQRRLLELNLAGGERLYGMIEDLLDLSRMEAGNVEYSPRRQDLAGLARTAVEEVGTLIGERGLELEEDFPVEPVTVACDRLAVVRVLRNLLSNAITYTPAGGALGIRVRPLTDPSDLPSRVRVGWPGDGYLPAAEVAIWDTGPGIPDGDKERVFERFVRLDGSGRRGTGLGLAISREVVTGHGGELWVEDGSERGSCFRFVLWARPPVEDPARAEGAADGGHRAASWAAVAVLACCLLPAAGCRGNRPPVVEPIEIREPSEVRESPAVDESGTPLEIADAAFDRGDYLAARAAYRDHLAGPAPAAEDRVLFRLAVIYVLPESPIRDLSRARHHLGALAERFPDSPFRAAAQYLLELRNEVQVLRGQLDEIKRIDLEGGAPPGAP